ncbi:MAG: hypothetical protein H7Z41_06790 [Cytophagales bacterium]|nr:hypothetical protein [Armatimonadota bacterium]
MEIGHLTQIKRRYTTVDRATDYIIAVGWDARALDKAKWFEAHVTVTDEKTNRALKLPRELATYRIGEIEHTFREYVALDFGGDREAAIDHLTDTIYRRLHQFIERGH